MTTAGQHTSRPLSPALPGDAPGMDLCPDPLTARTPAELAHAPRAFTRIFRTPVFASPPLAA